nr:ABC transporter permease [Streptococcus constellatus]
MEYTLPSNFLRDYLLSMTAFNMMSTAFFSFPSTLHTDKISNWQKTIVHSPVSVVEYYISKFLAMMIDYLPAITVVFSVGHIVRHVNVPMMDWFVSVGILMMGSAAFVVLGLLLALIPNTQFVSVIGNIVYMTLAILGGLWFPLTMFPSWMQAIGKTLPTYQLMNLISVYLSQHRLDWGSVL